MHRSHIRKEALKFSSAHMTVFPDGTKEALHGHNYSTELTVELRDIGLDSMVPFSELKTAVRALCQLWDEKVFLAQHCPLLKIVRDHAGELEFTLCGKRYVLPRDEVLMLPADNITTETLAHQFGMALVSKLDLTHRLPVITGLTVRIDESAGQGASYEWRRG